MILTDVNVLLYALVEHSAHHEVCRRELDRARRVPRNLAISELVLATVVRIATNLRVLRPGPSVQVSVSLHRGSARSSRRASAGIAAGTRWFWGFRAAQSRWPK